MEQKTESSQAADDLQLLDDDGENRAVRTFLMQYGVPSLTVGAMCQHMERSGWGHEYWPSFAKRHPAPRAEHLTKAGAQIWIRYLMSLERAALKDQPAPTEAPDFCPECHLQESQPDRLEMKIVGRRMADWLFGLAAAQDMPHKSWSETCSQLACLWSAVEGGAVAQAPAEAAQFPSTPEIDALMEKWGDDGATRGAAFIELRDKARQIEQAFYAAVEQVRAMADAGQGNLAIPRMAAQGEDSARLDAERYQFLRHADLDELARIYWPDSEVPVGEELDDIIDRARAGAETGGVKS